MKRAGMFVVGAFEPLKCRIVIPERDIDAGNLFTREVMRGSECFHSVKHALRIISAAHSRVGDGKARFWDTGYLGIFFIKLNASANIPFSRYVTANCEP